MTRVPFPGSTSSLPKRGLADLSRRINRLSPTRFALLMIAPGVLLLVIFVVLPILYSGVMSLQSINLVRAEQTRPFIGVDNFVKALTDDLFWASLGRSFYVAGVRVLLTVGLGLFFALLLNETFFGRGLLRVIILVPWAIAPVVGALMWQLIFNAKYGVLNAVLLAVGVITSYIAWMANPLLSIHIVILVETWRAVPFAALFLLAALQSIPASQYRAAKVDGANAWQCLRYVTLPALRKTILILVLVETIWALQLFDTLYILTQGGPGLKTTVLTYLVFTQAFESLNLGYASAIGLLLFLCILLSAGVIFWLIVRERRTRLPEDDAGRSAAKAEAEHAAPVWTLTEVGELPLLAGRQVRRRWPFLTPAVVNLSRRLGLAAGLALMVVWTLLPFVWIAIVSVQPMVNVTSVPPEIGLRAVNLEQYRAQLDDASFMLAMRNSMLVALITTALCVAVGSLAAYPLARMQLPYRNFFMGLVVSTRMVPAVTLLIPLFLVVRQLGLIDTLPSLILVYTAFFLPYILWMLRNFFEDIPRSLESAAMVDGCSRLGTLVRIIVPVSAPGVTAAAIFCLIVTWNEFLFALVLTTRSAKTLIVKIAEYRGLWDLPLNKLAAGGVMAILPIVLIVLLLSRQIIRGLTEGAVKG
jgi:ABC-type sugar transport system permease subunit